MLKKRQSKQILFVVCMSSCILFFQNCTPFAPGNGLGSNNTLGTGSGKTITGIQVQLNWAQPYTGQPLGFYIQQSTDGTNFTQIQSVAGTATSTTVTNLTNTKYYFRVVSYNATATANSQQLVVDLTNQ